MDDTPLHIIDIDPAELKKCTAAELHLPLFRTFYHFEEVGYLGRKGRPELEWAAVDLFKHPSFEDFIVRCRKVHKGNAVRAALKAARLGCYGKFFDCTSYTSDIMAIDMSAPVRGGHPMTPLYTRTLEERGGHPTRIAPETIPRQAASWRRYFGVFRQLEAQRQGEMISDEQLLAYLLLQRVGSFANYAVIIGHAGHLAEGIMYRMHFELIRMLIAARDAPVAVDASFDCLKGIRFIGYTTFYRNRDGIGMWKKRGLFEPMYLQCDYLAPSWIDPLCKAATDQPDDLIWQRQCARMLTTAAQRALDDGRFEEASQAQKGLAAVLERLGNKPLL